MEIAWGINKHTTLGIKLSQPQPGQEFEKQEI